MQKRFMNIIILVSLILISLINLSAQKAEPNLTDNNNNRIGKWIFFLDENLTVIDDSTNYTYYKLVNYVSGKAIGYVNYYYKSGKMYFQTPVKSLNPDLFSDGEIKYFSEKGDKIKSLTYQNGLLNGLAEYYHPDGKLWLQGNYTDNKRTGIWKQSDQDGKYGIGSFDGNLPEGKWTFYYANGALKSEGKFHDGVQTGVWTEYTETGETSEGTYLNGLPDGTWVCQYKTKKPCYIGSFIKGLKNGYWQEWDLLGRQSTGNYLNDARDGVWKVYDPNGNKLLQGSYINGLEEGQWKRYDAVGNVIENMLYRDGERVK